MIEFIILKGNNHSVLETIKFESSCFSTNYDFILQNGVLELNRRGYLSYIGSSLFKKTQIVAVCF